MGVRQIKNHKTSRSLCTRTCDWGQETPRLDTVKILLDNGRDVTGLSCPSSPTSFGAVVSWVRLRCDSVYPGTHPPDKTLVRERGTIQSEDLTSRWVQIFIEITRQPTGEVGQINMSSLSTLKVIYNTRGSHSYTIFLRGVSCL